MIKPVTSAPPAPAQQGDAGPTDASAGDAFGAVLARQVQEKSAPASQAKPTSNAAANQAPAAVIPSPDVAIPPDVASITIAALNKKDSKLPDAKSTDTKNRREPALQTPDAGVIMPVIAFAPDLRAVTSTAPGTAAVSTPVSATASASVDSKLGAIASSLVDPKLGAAASSPVDPKLGATASASVDPKLGAAASSPEDPKLGATASASVDPKLGAAASNQPLSPPRLDANASNTMVAAATSDFSRVLQDSASAPQLKSTPETRLSEVQGAQLAPVQFAMNAPSSPAAISAPLNSPAWAGEFSQKISWLSNQQSQVAELHLNPPDLGPMHVVISVTDNQATAQFSSPHSEVRHAIENALPKLRESLADNGIMLGNATVSDQTPRDSNRETQQRPSSRTIISTPEPAAINVPQVSVRRHTGMLDTFA